MFKEGKKKRGKKKRAPTKGPPLSNYQGWKGGELKKKSNIAENPSCPGDGKKEGEWGKREKKGASPVRSIRAETREKKGRKGGGETGPGFDRGGNKI